MTRYFGFAMADSMFNGECEIRRMQLSVEEVKVLVADGVQSCLNPSHVPTIKAMQARYGLDVPVPEKAPRVSLGSGDSLLVMGVRGLPRLEGRHEYTEEEINNATFSFALYLVK